MRKADNLSPSCVTKSGKLSFLEPSGTVQACNGTALLYLTQNYELQISLYLLLYSFFCVIPGVWILCADFSQGSVCSIFIGHVDKKIGSSFPHDLWRWNRQNVPKRRHIQFRCRELPKIRNITYTTRPKFEIKNLYCCYIYHLNPVWFESYIYWTVHHCISWKQKTNLMSLAVFISLLMRSASKADTTPTQQNRNTNTHRTKNTRPMW